MEIIIIALVATIGANLGTSLLKMNWSAAGWLTALILAFKYMK